MRGSSTAAALVAAVFPVPVKCDQDHVDFGVTSIVCDMCLLIRGLTMARPNEPRGPDLTSTRPHYLSAGTAHMLKEARMAAKLTQSEAAWSVGCAASFICELERGRKAPSKVMAAEIIRAYKLDGAQSGRLLKEAVGGVGRDRPSKRREGASA